MSVVATVVTTSIFIPCPRKRPNRIPPYQSCLRFFPSILLITALRAIFPDPNFRQCSHPCDLFLRQYIRHPRLWSQCISPARHRRDQRPRIRHDLHIHRIVHLRPLPLQPLQHPPFLGLACIKPPIRLALLQALILPPSLPLAPQLPQSNTSGVLRRLHPNLHHPAPQPRNPLPHLPLHLPLNPQKPTCLCPTHLPQILTIPYQLPAHAARDSTLQPCHCPPRPLGGTQT